MNLMSVKRKGTMPGFHAKAERPSRISKKKSVTESSGTGMSAARQVKAEAMPAWSGFFVKTLADIPAGCICDWIYHKGVLEIKFINALCSSTHEVWGKL